MKPFAGNQVYN